jgi:ubiquinone/menaquinone biosynthesis C-methylase UbiE
MRCAAMPDRNPAERFAEVYDVLYSASADDPFLTVQLAFLLRYLGEPSASILDAGCGTGRHVAPLAQRGYRVVGLDVSRTMLKQAQGKSDRGAPRFVQGNLLALPFRDETFDAALCLESPLAYLQTREELRTALASLRRVLRAGARIIVDVFDYPGTLGYAPIAPQVAVFATPWGAVEVAESHRYDLPGGVWHMRQEFTVQKGSSREQFVVEHRLRVRSPGEYAAELEAAGFAIEELLSAYPAAPDALRGERRLIFVARAAQPSIR